MESDAATADTRNPTPAAVFAAELRELRRGAGDPSYRRMAALSGCISHATLHEAAVGARFPSWETTREFVKACGGDETEWRARWERAKGGSAPAPQAAPTVTESVHEQEPVAQPETVQLPVPDLSAAPVPEQGNRRLLRPAAVSLLSGLIVLIGVSVFLVNYLTPAEPTGPGSPSPAPGAAAPRTPEVSLPIPGDASQFLGDATIPDGTVVKPGQHFVKVWEVQNTGSVPWQNRYLQRQDLPTQRGRCTAPDRVPIPDARPGERVQLSVPVTAQHEPGSCWVGWKVVDDHGRMFYPSARPMFFLVTVSG